MVKIVQFEDGRYGCKKRDWIFLFPEEKFLTNNGTWDYISENNEVPMYCRFWSIEAAEQAIQNYNDTLKERYSSKDHGIPIPNQTFFQKLISKFKRAQNES